MGNAVLSKIWTRIAGPILYDGNQCSPIVLETKVRSQVDSKDLLDASLLNTLHYKVRTEGKWSNPGKRVAPSSRPTYI